MDEKQEEIYQLQAGGHEKRGKPDWIIQSLGNPGRYQVILFIMCASNYITCAFGHLSMVLFAQVYQASY